MAERADAELRADVLRGDDSAFAVIYRRYLPTRDVLEGHAGFRRLAQSGCGSLDLASLQRDHSSEFECAISGRNAISRASTRAATS